ncbi:MAG TPA: Gfo/Idh/MocA family oxidoreductase [Nakamurella sp.]
MQPLRIGILGAARIAELALIEPAAATGHTVVAVAARDDQRAKDYARRHGIDRAHSSYQDLIDDPDVEVVYNPLVNSLHAEWNIAALRAGKQVLSEKPFASNAVEAVAVQAVAAGSAGTIVEGFHYLHHPVAGRIREIVESGVLGELRSVDIDMQMAAPPDNDPRWSFELAGGALMDLGCYALHAQRQFGRWTSGEPTIVSAAGGERAGRLGVDEWMRVELVFPGGLPGTVTVNMAAAGERSMPWTITGDRGSVTAPSWPVPHLDDRVILTTAEGTVVESLGTRTSYTYQLEAFASSLRGGGPFPLDAADAVANMRLVDSAYLAAGFPVRGTP